MNRCLLIATLFFVAACATSDPQPSQTEYAQPVNTAANDTAVRNTAAQPAQAANDASGTAASASSDYESIEDVEAPKASETPAAMIPRIPREPEVVCEKVRPTGSILPVEVCRRRADIDKQRDEDQDAFGKIKSNTANAASRL